MKFAKAAKTHIYEKCKYNPANIAGYVGDEKKADRVKKAEEFGQIMNTNEENKTTRYNNKVVGDSPEICRALDSHGFFPLREIN